MNMQCPKCKDLYGRCATRCINCDCALIPEPARTSEETVPTPARGSGALTWSEEKPKAAGWWWCDDKDYDAPCVRRVTMFAGKLQVYLPMNNIWGQKGQNWLPMDMCLPQWRWAGPLPEPLEASDEATLPTSG